MELCAGTAEGLVVLGPERRTLLEGADIHSLALVDGGLLALADGHSLWRVENDDAQELARYRDLRLNCLLPTGSGVLIGAAEARLLRLADGALQPLAGFDRAEGRSNWYTPWSGPPDIRSLALTRSGALLANVHVGGILRSEDGGETWAQTIDIDSDVHEVMASRESGSEMLLAATAWGLAASGEGREWTFSEEGLHASYCRAVTLVEDTVFLSASVGPFGGRAAMYRREIDGSRFEKCERGLPEWFPENIDTGCLAAVGSTVAFGTAGGSVFVSGDGESWEQAAADLAPVRWLEASPE